MKSELKIVLHSSNFSEFAYWLRVVLPHKSLESICEITEHPMKLLFRNEQPHVYLFTKITYAVYVFRYRWRSIFWKFLFQIQNSGHWASLGKCYLYRIQTAKKNLEIRSNTYEDDTNRSGWRIISFIWFIFLLEYMYIYVLLAAWDHLEMSVTPGLWS